MVLVSIRLDLWKWIRLRAVSFMRLKRGRGWAIHPLPPLARTTRTTSTNATATYCTVTVAMHPPRCQAWITRPPHRRPPVIPWQRRLWCDRRNSALLVARNHILHRNILANSLFLSLHCSTANLSTSMSSISAPTSSTTRSEADGWFRIRGRAPFPMLRGAWRSCQRCIHHHASSSLGPQQAPGGRCPAPPSPPSSGVVHESSLSNTSHPHDCASRGILVAPTSSAKTSTTTNNNKNNNKHNEEDQTYKGKESEIVLSVNNAVDQLEWEDPRTIGRTSESTPGPEPQQKMVTASTTAWDAFLQQLHKLSQPPSFNSLDHPHSGNKNGEKNSSNAPKTLFTSGAMRLDNADRGKTEKVEQDAVGGREGAEGGSATRLLSGAIPPQKTSSVFTSCQNGLPIPLGPFFCTSLRECHVLASELWRRYVSTSATLEAGTNTLSSPNHAAAALDHLELILQWWNAVSSTIHVPRDVEAVEDVLLFLSDVLHWPRRAAAPGGTNPLLTDAAERERLLRDIDEWILLHDPPLPAPRPVLSIPPPLHSRTQPALEAATGHTTRTTTESVDLLRLHPRPSGTPDPPATNDDEGRDEKTTAMDLSASISYTRLLGLLISYVRYHQGVAWGVSHSPHDLALSSKMGKAAYYRRRYHLHPWDNVYCPMGGEQQRPYVDVLQWMLLSRDRLREPSPPLPRSIRGFRAPFVPPAPVEEGRGNPHTNNTCGFSALDVCSQSGFGVDLLLKAGAEHVIAADASLMATANTEATYHEHMRERRSGGGGVSRRLTAIRADVLPERSHTSLGSSSATRGRSSSSGTSSSAPTDSSPATVFEAAAIRRRRAAQQLGQKLGAPPVPVDSPVEQGEASQRPHSATTVTYGNGAWTTPVGLLWYHPPVPNTILPFSVHPLRPPPRANDHDHHHHEENIKNNIPAVSRWWHTVLEEHHALIQWQRQACGEDSSRGAVTPPPDTAAARFLPLPSLSPTDGDLHVLPWLALPAPPSHAHHSRRILQQFVDELLQEPRTPTHGVPPRPTAHTTQKPFPVLQLGGYVVCLLPRTYHPLDEMRSTLRRRLRGTGNASEDGGRHKSLDDTINVLIEDSLSDMVVQGLAGLGGSSTPGSGVSSMDQYELIQLKRYPVSLRAASTTPTTTLRTTGVLRGKDDLKGGSAVSNVAGGHERMHMTGPSSEDEDLGWIYLAASVIPQRGKEKKDGRSKENNANAASSLHSGAARVARRHLLQEWKASTPLQWVDLLVFRKKASRASDGVSTALKDTPPALVVEWENSLEYDEYLPADFPTQHHWTDQLPTYSYLEEDFGGTGSATASHHRQPLTLTHSTQSHASPPLTVLPETNVLAHGPLTVEKLRRRHAALQSSSSRSESNGDIDDDSVPESAWKADAHAASAMFHTIFREELRRKRSHKKFRHTALSSSRDQQEWYINEKLIQSEGAKVELMNQLARFDFQQNFDH